MADLLVRFPTFHQYNLTIASWVLRQTQRIKLILVEVTMLHPDIDHRV